MGDTPKYNAPPVNPLLASLMQETKQQDVTAVESSIKGDTASLTARYGQLTSGDTAAILARYGTRLALAQQGGSANAALSSPLVARAYG